MIHRAVRSVALPLVLVLALGAGSASAQYRYGGGTSDLEEQGGFVFLDAMYANVRNTDSLIAVVEVPTGSVQQTVPVYPEWGDEFSGRIGGGYQWSNGHRLLASYWQFETDQQVTGGAPAGSRTQFAIGPAIRLPNGGTIGRTGSPGSLSINTEISASTIDLAWGRTEGLTDDFDLDWSLGLRFVRYEETMAGLYGQVAGFDMGRPSTVAASREIDNDMLGARMALRVHYHFTPRWSVWGGVGYAFLDGTVNNRSSLDPVSGATVNGAEVPSSLVVVDDDGRSGTTLDLDFAVAWHAPSGRFRLALGWEQQIWDGIPLLVVSEQQRDEVTFSGYKLGLYFSF